MNFVRSECEQAHLFALIAVAVECLAFILTVLATFTWFVYLSLSYIGRQKDTQISSNTPENNPTTWPECSIRPGAQLLL